jgi:hypothetical protein
MQIKMLDINSLPTTRLWVCVHRELECGAISAKFVTHQIGGAARIKKFYFIPRRSNLPFLEMMQNVKYNLAILKPMVQTNCELEQWCKSSVFRFLNFFIFAFLISYEANKKINEKQKMLEYFEGFMGGQKTCMYMIWHPWIPWI